MSQPQQAVPLIQLSAVTKSYRQGELESTVLHGIDLAIHEGEFLAIVGASGSGKSTLMNILGCLDRPGSGRYLFRGQDVSGLSRDELARLRREEFGFVFQSYHLIAAGTAVENVEMPAMYAGVPHAERRVRAVQLLRELGLEERLYHRPSQLSGGQQQRVSIARALMNGGRIILADEPTGALDSKSGADVMRLLKDLSQRGHTVILITHAAEVAAHASRVIEIRDGHILSDSGHQGEAAANYQPPLVHRAFSTLADLAETVRLALRSLRGNLFRAVLTLLGIVIGVGSVIAMMAIGDGAKQRVVDNISAMGSNLLLVRPGGSNQRGFSPSTLVLEDVAAINKQVDNVLAAVPEQQNSVTLRAGENDVSTTLIATSASYPLARNWALSSGTFFTEEDDDSYAGVAVLGKTAAENLFPGNPSPLGEFVMANNVMLQVVGIMSRKGASPSGMDQDDVIIVPYATNNLRISGARSLRNVNVAVKDVARIDEAQAAVEQLLAERHGKVDFQIRNMASIIATTEETQNTMTLLLGAIAAISLLVGGIGVMNIMLVSVTERTREIGIRMATGARERNILQQFLIEALVVSAIGGAIGVVAGLGTAWLIAAFDTPVKITVMPIVLAFGCAFSTGLLFGYLPARKAAQMDPVAALASD